MQCSTCGNLTLTICIFYYCMNMNLQISKYSIHKFFVYEHPNKAGLKYLKILVELGVKIKIWNKQPNITLRKLPKFHLISWNGNFVEAYIFGRVSGESQDFFSKCDHSRSFLRICSHLLKKFVIENCGTFLGCKLIL